MSDVKFSELLTASYLSRNDYIVILRTGSATEPDQGEAPNNYTVQAKFFTASYATHSISSSHALTASYIKFSDINAGVGVFTLLSGDVVIGTNTTASNITASGYVSASTINGATSMSSPIGIFTNTTSSNITASGYVSASTIRGVTSVTSPIGIFTNTTSSNITASGYVSASTIQGVTSMSSPIGIFTNITSSNITASGYVSASTIRGVTSVTSPIGIFTNISSSNITASGYVSASVMRAAISMSSPIGIFTNITASNISASGYVSASAMSSSLFYGTASYSITSLYPAVTFEDGYQAVSFSSTPNSNTGRFVNGGFEYFWTKNNKIGKIGFNTDTIRTFLSNHDKSEYSPYVNFSDGFMISGSNVTRSMLDTSNKNIIKLCSNLSNLYVLFDDGTLIGWGYNSYGQLGQGNTIASFINSNTTSPAIETSPWVMMSGKGSLSGKKVIDIDIHSSHGNVGEDQSLLILTSTASGNNLHVCGRNNWGQLGIGDHTNTPTQQTIRAITDYQSGSISSSFFTNLTMSKIFNGGVTSHVIDTGSSLYSCGRNTVGSLGTGGVGSNHTSSFKYITNNVKTITLGTNNDALRQSFIIKNDNTVWGTGENTSYGELGIGNSLDKYIYTQLSISASSISVHTQHTSINTYTAILTNTGDLTGEPVDYFEGKIKSWGYNDRGLIGDDTIINKTVPTFPIGVYADEINNETFGARGGNVVKVAPSFSYTGNYSVNYVLTTDGSVYSVGDCVHTMVRGLNQSNLTQTEQITYQKLIFNMKSGEKVVDISTGHRNEYYAALYLLTNMGNILTCGTYYANGSPINCHSYMPKYVYRNGQFVSYLSTA